MCTIVFAWQQFADAPIAVAANRDEQYDRDSRPPSRLDAERTIVAPQDVTAGGTWIGYNDAGVFAGITNRWVDGLEGERSRGLLVRDVLETEAATVAVDAVEDAIETVAYEGFNLLLADATAAYLLEWGGQLRVRRLDPGVHVLVNVGPDDDPLVPTPNHPRGLRQAINARSVRSALDATPGETPAQWFARASDVLTDHGFGVCLHDEEFGTVSTSLIRIDGRTADYRFAPGPPCETSFERVADGSF